MTAMPQLVQVETQVLALADLHVSATPLRAVLKAFIREHHSLLPNPPGVWRHGFMLTDRAGNLLGVACWSHPAATNEDQHATLELLRMALLSGLPHNTASWMLGQMRAYLRKHCPHIKRLISYHDADRHHGTIYRADNWNAVPLTDHRAKSRAHRPGRTAGNERTNKVKWERSP